MDLDLFLHFLNIILYGGMAYFGHFVILRKMYGGKFTSALPYLAAAIGVLFYIQLISLFQVTLFPVFYPLYEVRIGFLALQIVAGVFLLSALYSMYQMGYVMSGFVFEEEKK